VTPLHVNAPAVSAAIPNPMPEGTADLRSGGPSLEEKAANQNAARQVAAPPAESIVAEVV
jgi:hypothetical protein